jgi:sugar/nucleoside kinase (ribokinase family)/uncharacterized membrane protein
MMTDSKTKPTYRLDQPLRKTAWVNRGYKESGFASDVSEAIAGFLGTPKFIFWLTIFCILWLGWNTLAPENWRFDSADHGFTALTLMLSLQASYAAPLILFAQNKQAQRDQVSIEQDREDAARNLNDTEFILREIADIRLAIQDIATTDFVANELREVLKEAQTENRKQLTEDRRQMTKEGKSPVRNTSGSATEDNSYLSSDICHLTSKELTPNSSFLTPSHGVTVIGGITQDIGGKSRYPITAADKNIGTVNTSLGGVGCNIARNLASLQIPVNLVTALGNDWFKNVALAQLELYRINADLSYFSSTTGSATYLFILDSDGNMKLALSDFAVVDELTPKFFETILYQLTDSVLVLDCNLVADSIAYICQNYTGTIIVDPVSHKKAERILPVLDKLDYVTPNLMEAQTLADSNSSDPEFLADQILARGVKNVIITLDAQGCYYASSLQKTEDSLQKTEDIGYQGVSALGSATDIDSYLLSDICYLTSEKPITSHSSLFTDKGYLSPIPSQLINATGAGDAFTAGLVYGLLQGRTLANMCRDGLAMASLAIESPSTVNDQISLELFERRRNGNE